MNKSSAVGGKSQVVAGEGPELHISKKTAGEGTTVQRQKETADAKSPLHSRVMLSSTKSPRYMSSPAKSPRHGFSMRAGGGGGGVAERGQPLGSRGEPLVFPSGCAASAASEEHDRSSTLLSARSSGLPEWECDAGDGWVNDVVEPTQEGNTLSFKFVRGDAQSLYDRSLSNIKQNPMFDGQQLHTFRDKRTGMKKKS